MIAIVTDSTVCMSRKEAADYGVRIVPISYTLSARGCSETYVEPDNADPRAFFDHDGQTASPNPLAFVGAFEDLLRCGHDVLCVTISSRLSGTLNNALIAAKEVGGNRIRVVDSLSTAGGLYLLIKQACALIRDGLSLEAVASRLELLRERITIVFTVEDTAPLRRSGRFSLVRQSVSTILNRKPLLMCKGGVVLAHDTIRGKQEVIRSLVGELPASVAGAIVHFIEEKALALQTGQAIEQARPGAPVEIRPLGAVLGIHLGAGCVAIAWMSGE